MKKSWGDKVEVTANRFKESALSPEDVEWAQEGETALGQIEDVRNNVRKVFQQMRCGYGYGMPHNPLREGRTEEATQKESTGNSSWRLFWLFRKLSALLVMHGTGGNNCSPTQLPHLMDGHCTAIASPLLEDPRSSQQSCLAYEPWNMAGALHSARGAMKACVLRSWTAKDLTSGVTSHHSLFVSQSEAAQKRLNKICGTLHVCTQITAGRNMRCRLLVYCSGICRTTERQ